ncbi:aminoglycoside phosphotransferase family protein [Sorangium sp. So ce321]|uniref:phosphotransferase family protein n=1 Tax=Sorangium sp. So ce321 TaxID=3133300 RepID=UPI003F6345A8
MSEQPGHGLQGGLPFWSETELACWLDSRGLLGAHRITKISPMSHRAMAALVELDDGSALFVKRPMPHRREGMLLTLISGREDLRGVRDLLPSLLHHDEASNVTVTAGLTHQRSMRELCMARPPEDGSLVRMVAEGLSRLHATSKASGLAAEGACPKHVENPTPTYGGLSPTNFAHAVGIGFPGFLAAAQEINGPLRSLRDAWHPECLIHGDFKDDNIMVDARSAQAPKLTFIDWELGGWGDPLWDVGCLVGQFLYHWVASIQPSKEKDFASWVRNAAVPFAEVRRASSAFVSCYAAASGRALEGPNGCLTKIVQFAGLFLLYRAIATLEVMGMLPSSASYCLQVGRALIGTPEKSKAIVIGQLS